MFALQSYVENLIGGDTSITIAPRIYQLVQGTGDNLHKYYLRYKENNDESDWVVDTSSYIDLENLDKIVNWIGSDIDDYADLATRTGRQTLYYISQLTNFKVQLVYFKDNGDIKWLLLQLQIESIK